MMNPGDYTFLFVLGMVFAFLDSYGIGANDVSNSFGAAVGSKALNLKQAVLIATVCKFLGAFLMGSATADTIKGGLIDVNLFAAQPELLMLGMVCSLVGSSTWVLFASSRGWPVSTTHAIVGAITGIVIAGFGANTVKWSRLARLSAAGSSRPSVPVTTFIFLVTKFLILRHQDSFKRGLIALPFYFAITIFINVFYIIYKGSPGLSLSKLSIGAILGIAFGIAGAVFLWCFFFLRPYLQRKIENDEPLRWYHSFWTPFLKPRQARRPSVLVEMAGEKSGASSSVHPLSPKGEKVKSIDESIPTPSSGSVNSGLAALDDTPPPSRAKALFKKIKAKTMHGLDQDINTNSTEVNQIHDNSTRYDSKTEQVFCTLQVLTSCFASFAHGSNDVANAIGPLTTIYYVWRNGAVDITGEAPIPTWILAYGGIAIDIGLLTYVLTCSKLGLPVSTTHCITGATTSVGLCSGGGVKSINWKMLGLVASSWVFTLPAAGLVSGLIFAITIYSPHKISYDT
ncbi:hypothetical protein BGX23_009628 [Mortierella sp. AD031]|nr:hypothetical protein BGX23_009628 [Mortierella sp. AD031]